MIAYLLIRLFTFPLRFIPYPAVHALGRFLGRCMYYAIPKFRKRALSNLALATDLRLSNSEIVEKAKQSFENLMTTALEYAKLSKEKNIHRVAVCENPDEAKKLMETGNSPIFFCAHQANWEILFLEGTSRMKGVAIGRPIKNRFLYNWIVAMRQQYGGKIVQPREAVKEGLRGLKQGAFLGIVGDQGMPDSGFSSPFFGRRAWTSPLPALLSYKTGHPLFFAAVRRENGKYFIHYSDPIFPDTQLPMDQEVDRMMKRVLHLLEESIRRNIGQWLWQHNRWKQQTPKRLKRRFRHESILIILPRDGKILDHLAVFREIYPFEFITLLAPPELRAKSLIEDSELLTYQKPEEMLLDDFRFKLVFNFTGNCNVARHYKKLSAFVVVDAKEVGTTAESLRSCLYAG
jgi:KDO2-lipid IV(A) lauroyltransferase